MSNAAGVSLPRTGTKVRLRLCLFTYDFVPISLLGLVKVTAMGTSAVMQMDYYDTYWFANLVQNLMLSPSAYARDLEEFFGDLQYRKFLRPFPKVSALHLFIEFALETVMYQNLDDVVEDALVNDPKFRLWSELALAYHSIPHNSFHAWREAQGIAKNDITEDVIVDYHGTLRGDGPLDSLFDQMREEVFFLMFLNREFLRRFNEIIAFYISGLSPGGVEPDEGALFKKRGVLRRARIPVWAKRAVFYRDRGRCVFCSRDISGLVSIYNNKHFDHIVPLSMSGINDITNLQLLCEACNVGKGAESRATSKQYERWYG